MIFYFAIATAISTVLLAAIFATRLRNHHYDLFVEVGSPARHIWYPNWVFKFLKAKYYSRLSGSEKTLVVFLMFIQLIALGVVANVFFIAFQESFK